MTIGKKLYPGQIYIIKEVEPYLSFLLFGHLVDNGVPGFCVTTQTPELVRERYRLAKIRYDTKTESPMWLYNLRPDGNIITEKNYESGKIPKTTGASDIKNVIRGLGFVEKVQLKTKIL